MATGSKQDSFIGLINSSKLSKQDMVKLLLESITKDEQTKRENKMTDSKGTMNKFAFANALKTGETKVTTIGHGANTASIAIHSSVLDCIDKPFSRGLSPKLGKLERLGKGGFGAAYKFTPSTHDLINVVIKCTKRLDRNNPKPSWHREIQHTRKLIHRNVIKYYGEPIIYNGNVYNVMEYGGQSIAKRYFKIGTMPDQELKKAMFAVASGLDYLHSERAGANYVVHRDIRCDNITVTDDGVYKIIDFGISSKTTVDNSRFESETHWGHPFWKSPEYCRYMMAQGPNPDVTPPHVKAPGRKSDIWSFGVLILEMKSFPERPSYFYGRHIYIHDLAQGRIVLVDYIREEWPDQIKDVLQRCFEVDEIARVDSKRLKALCANFFHSTVPVCEPGDVVVDHPGTGTGTGTDLPKPGKAREDTDRGDILEIAKSYGMEIHQLYCQRPKGSGPLGPIMLPPVPKQPFIDVFSMSDLTKKRIQKENEQHIQCEAEIAVYRALESIDNDKMTVLWQFKYTHEQYQRFVGNHECKTQPHEIEGECDFVVLFENIVVILNVKAPQFQDKNDDKRFGRNVSDSLKQRDRTRFLVECIAKITDNNEPPIILEFSVFNRVEKITAESFSTFKRKSDDEKMTIVFKEDMDNFTGWWNDNVVSRSSVNGSSNKSSLRSMLIGLWCMGDRNNYNTDKSSLFYWIEEINKSLRCITRCPEAPLSTNIKGGSYIFKKHLNIECITEAQKSILNEEANCLFICGSAGSGKTALMLGKIIDLVMKCKTEKKVVLLVCGESSAKHCELVLTHAFNSDGTDEIKATRLQIQQDCEDSKTNSTSTLQDTQDMEENSHVIILWRKYRPSYSYTDLMADMLEPFIDKYYHIFIDDIQDVLHMDISGNNKIRFLDVCSSAFDNRSLTEGAVSSSVFWVTSDIAQDSSILTTVKDQPQCNDFDRFPINSIKTLQANFRNTFEISNMLAVIRKEMIDNSNTHHLENVTPLQQLGHYIHGPKPQLYVISEDNNDIISQKNIVSSVVHCELDKLSSTKDIALVCSISDGDQYIRCADVYQWKNYLEDVVVGQRAGTQNIGVFAVENTLSLEWPAMIAVVDTLYSGMTNEFCNILYKTISRAKVYCSVIILLHPRSDSYQNLFRKLEPLANVKYID